MLSVVNYFIPLRKSNILDYEEIIAFDACVVCVFAVLCCFGAGVDVDSLLHFQYPFEERW